MVDRIITWYLPEVTGDGTNQSAAYCLEQSYALPAKVRLYAHKAPDSGDLVVDIKANGVSIFGTHQVSTIETNNEYSYIEYNNLATSTFSVKELISGGTSSASAEIMAIDGKHLDLRMIKETAFAVNESILGATNSATATVNAFVRGQTKPKWVITDSNYGAVLPKGHNSEEYAEDFANDKSVIDQYSWLTLDVVESGGAKQITVQLELDHGYKEDEQDDND